MFRRVTPFLLLHLLYCSSLPAATPRGDDRTVFNVRSYGAVGDGSTNDRDALQRAIDSCARTGGTVWFPPGKYLTGSLELYDDVDLYVGRGATILGSTNLRDYREYIPKIPSYNDLFLRHSLLYAEGKHNISLRGEGTIDGQGSAFLVTTKVKPDRYKNRPYVIRFVGCKNVTVQDVTLQNSAMWMQQYLACEDVEIRGIRVYNHANLNNDMIDIDGCRNVVMADCIGDTEDDAITLKSTSPFITENVVITNCVVSSHCNAIKTGTESTGGFRNIAVSNIVIKPSAVTEGRVGHPAGNQWYHPCHRGWWGAGWHHHLQHPDRRSAGAAVSPAREPGPEVHRGCESTRRRFVFEYLCTECHSGQCRCNRMPHRRNPGPSGGEHHPE